MKMKEMSEATGLSEHALRYYEREGLLFDVKRTPSGRREYSKKDVEMVEVLECLKAAGLSISDIKEFIHLFRGGEETYPQRADLFRRQAGSLRSRIAELQTQLDVADYKTWYYENVLELGADDGPLVCLKMRERYEKMAKGQPPRG
ncbi:MAG: MerR family transcriptional regulator [Collinsella sp.]|nr:MerR family transcriptional regulator [Collinsella sp.]